MATILEFRILTGQSRSRPRVDGMQVTAQIVFFPGVRVSYWDEALVETDDVPPTPQTSKRKSKGSRRR